MKAKLNPFTILLEEDDLPVCPVHGTRIITDYIEANDYDPIPHEVGRCQLCRKVYRFETDERMKL